MKQTTSFIILSILFLFGCTLWFVSPPTGIDIKAWHLFAIFTPTVIAIILKPLPMSVVAVLSLTFTLLTNTLSFQEAFSGFSNDIVWLVVFAFFISRSFIATGLGSRMAYQVMSVLGKNTLGLGYGLVATDLILAPAIPSITARSGGIVYPILRALSDVFTGASHDPKLSSFLTLTAFQGTVITSAMFLTAMAGNPLIAELAKGEGVTITWTSWATAALIPGLLSLMVVPYFIYWYISPVIKKTPHASSMAHEKLKDMGPMKRQEKTVLATFILLVFLWIFGNQLNIKATPAAMIGLSLLLVTDILKWKDVLLESVAWDTFIWFSTLVTLATFLNKFGFTTWFSHWIVGHVSGFFWIPGFLIVSLVYFYSHYLFASNVAHIGAMYPPFLIVSIALGTPPELAALLLGFFSNLFGGLTHYGCGPAPIFFGTGFVSIQTWWKVGGIASLINVLIWTVIGGSWWKILGLW